MSRTVSARLAFSPAGVIFLSVALAGLLFLIGCGTEPEPVPVAGSGDGTFSTTTAAVLSDQSGLGDGSDASTEPTATSETLTMEKPAAGDAPSTPAAEVPVMPDSSVEPQSSLTELLAAHGVAAEVHRRLVGGQTGALPARSQQSPAAPAMMQVAAEASGTRTTGAPHASRDMGSSFPPEAGGTDNPNDKPLPLVYFQGHGVNPFVDADEDALSTFSLDADTASFEVAQLYFDLGSLPPPDSVRLEEWVNAFPAGYSARDDSGDGHVVGLRLDGMMAPFAADGTGDESDAVADDYRLLRVGVASNVNASTPRDPVSIIFVVDISGSMGGDDRLGVAKRVMAGIVDALRPDDRVGLVTYGSYAEVRHEMTLASEAGDLLGSIRELVPEGATNVEQGIVQAYRLAAGELEMDGRPVRVVIFSDGVGNLGATGPDSVLELVDEAAQRGAALTAIGVGVGGNYNDVMLEALANRGNGVYHYIRGDDPADSFLAHSLESVFRDTARDARVQVEFNPDVVRKYRLLGYENRAVADTDFRSDDLDFGEVGFARDVVALYEVRLHSSDADADAELAVARLRWRDFGTGEVSEIEESVSVGAVSVAVDDAPQALVRAAAVAEFAELMRLSYWAQCGSLDSVAELLETVSDEDPDSMLVDAMLTDAEPLFDPFCAR